MAGRTNLERVPVFATLAILWLAATSTLTAQSRRSQPTFRSGVDLVTLDVCVKDVAGRPVGSLEAADFFLFDDGRPQHVAFFVPAERLAIEAVLLLDRSASMYGEKIVQAKHAAAAFIDALGPDDRVGALAFNERAEWAAPLGSERATALAAIEALSATGATGLFEAIHIATRALEARRGAAESRQALVVLSDGEDTSSRLDFEEVLDATRRSGVVVYAVSLHTDERGRELAVPFELAQLAFDTGGRTFTPRGRTLASIYEEIAAELRHLYRLGYVPDRERADGRWHQIAVRLTNRDAVIRTRSGYYARAPRPLMELPSLAH